MTGHSKTGGPSEKKGTKGNKSKSSNNKARKRSSSLNGGTAGNYDRVGELFIGDGGHQMEIWLNNKVKVRRKVLLRERENNKGGTGKERRGGNQINCLNRRGARPGVLKVYKSSLMDTEKKRDTAKAALYDGTY